MSKKLSAAVTIVLCLFCALVSFQITYVSMIGKVRKAEAQTALSNSAYEKLNYVDQLYRQYYVGDIDETQLSDYLIRGYIVGAGDKYASYMTPEEYAAQRADSTGEMVGVGIHVIYNNDLGALEIISVVRDSPAEEAGVMPGDLIISVGGESVGELGYYPAVDKMLGDLGTAANFTVVRGENYAEVKDFSIIRAKVNNTTVGSRMYDSEIGIIRIEEFDANTGTCVRDEVAKLKESGAKKLIFDVRNNPGGLLDGIVDTLDFLLPEGPIIRIVDKEGNEEQIKSDADSLGMPICVLVNGSTASAAELFSSALQDYKLATLVGVNTYGKGTMQTVIPLPDGSGLSFSYRMYNPPFSDNYEGIGVKPDVEVELDEALKTKNFYKITDEEDNQLQAAIEILKQK